MSTKVRKGNKILTIADDAIERYVNQGYSVIDETGAVVTKAVPTSNNQLKAEYIGMSEEIENLKAEIKELKASNDYLSQENVKLIKELTALKSAPISGTETKTTTRKRKQTTEDVSETAE